MSQDDQPADQYPLDQGGADWMADQSPKKPNKYWHRSYRNSLVMLLRIESGLLTLLSLYLLFAPIFSHITHVSAWIAQIIFALLGALGLFLSGRSFSSGRRAGTGFALLANGIGLGVAYFAAKGHAYILALPLSLISALAIWLIFATLRRE